MKKGVMDRRADRRTKGRVDVGGGDRENGDGGVDGPKGEERESGSSCNG